MKETIDLLRKEINPLDGSLYLSRTATGHLMKILDEVVAMIDSYERVTKEMKEKNLSKGSFGSMRDRSW